MFNFVTDILDSMAEEFQDALYDDMQNPEAVESLNNFIDDTVIKVLGIDVRHPLIRNKYNQYMGSLKGDLLEYLGLIMNDSENMDIASDMIKSEVNTSVDSFTNKLKQRLKENVSCQQDMSH